MSHPTWPSELPQWLRVEGYSNELPETRMTTPMEVGPGKLRRRSSLAAVPVTGRLVLRRGDLARLKRFWFEEIDQGISPFWFPDQDAMAVLLTDGQGRRLRNEDGRGLQVSAWWLVQFVVGGQPAWSARNRVLRQVDINLNVLP